MKHFAWIDPWINRTFWSTINFVGYGWPVAIMLSLAVNQLLHNSRVSSVLLNIDPSGKKEE